MKENRDNLMKSLISALYSIKRVIEEKNNKETENEETSNNEENIDNQQNNLPKIIAVDYETTVGYQRTNIETLDDINDINVSNVISDFTLVWDKTFNLELTTPVLIDKWGNVYCVGRAVGATFIRNQLYPNDGWIISSHSKYVKNEPPKFPQYRPIDAEIKGFLINIEDVDTVMNYLDYNYDPSDTETELAIDYNDTYGVTTKACFIQGITDDNGTKKGKIIITLDEDFNDFYVALNFISGIFNAINDGKYNHSGNEDIFELVSGTVFVLRDSDASGVYDVQEIVFYDMDFFKFMVSRRNSTKETVYDDIGGGQYSYYTY